MLGLPLLQYKDTPFSPEKKFLVAVSGGADSVALLYLLLEHGFSNLHVLHVNHQLRGKESTADATFVKTMCKSLQIPCSIEKVNVKQRMKMHGESLETAARNLRHIIFAKVAREQKCKRIFLAHHGDDQAETALWNLARGSHGIRAMEQVKEMKCDGVKLTLLRPLLHLRRNDLRNYLTKNKIAWREDASNAESFTARNRIRLELLPLYEKIMERDVVPALLRQLEAQAEQAEIGTWLLAKILDPQGRLHLGELRKLPPPLVKCVIREYLTNHGVQDISRQLLESAAQLLDVNSAAKCNLPAGKFLRRKESRIFLEA